VSVIVKDSPVGLNASANHVKIEEKNQLIFIFLNLLSLFDSSKLFSAKEIIQNI
jgi:hypothetical protein